MTETLRNQPWEDEDMRLVIEAIEEMEDEKTSIRATAAADCGVIAKRIKAKKKEAKDACGIPKDILNGLLEQRKLERKLKANAEAIDEAHIELFEESSGQWSIFAPVADEPPAPRDEPVAKKAARRAKKAAEAHQAKEQEEGAAVLDELASGAAVN